MTMFLAPYTAIADIDGSPLDAGFLFFGEYGKDPELFPVEAFWDADFTVPAAQPIRTRNGYPVRNGSPTKVYLKTAEHSIVIKNRNSAFILVDFKNKGWDASFVVDASGQTQQKINDGLESIDDLARITKPKNGMRVFVKSRIAGKNLGGGHFEYNKTSTLTPDGGRVFNHPSGGRFVRISMEIWSAAEWYGVVHDGATDDVVAWERIVASQSSHVTMQKGTSICSRGFVVAANRKGLVIEGESYENEPTNSYIASSEILFTLSSNNNIAVKAQNYSTTFINFGLRNSNPSDGLASIGFYHAQPSSGTAGRLTHKGLKVYGFSDSQVVIRQAMCYTFEKGTLYGGNFGLKMLRSENDAVHSTTLSMYGTHCVSNKKNCLWLEGSDAYLSGVVMEHSGKGTHADKTTDAAIYNATSQLTCIGTYYEQNYRNVYSRIGYTSINERKLTSTVPDVFAYNPETALQKDFGTVVIERNTLKTRYLYGDDTVDGVLRIKSITYSDQAFLVKDVLSVGSNATEGDVTGNTSINLVSNKNTGEGLTNGQFLNFGVSNSSVGSTSSWIQLAHKRTANTGKSELGVYSNTGTTKYDPDGTAIQIVGFNTDKGFSNYPKPSATPTNNGEMLFELTSDTQLKVKVKGSDGIVRSTVLTLA